MVLTPVRLRKVYLVSSLVIPLFSYLVTASAEGILTSDELIRELGAPPPRTRGLIKIKDKDVTVTHAAQSNTERITASVILNIPFAYNSSKLSNSSIAQLQELGKALNSQALGSYSFEIAGHTDATGDASYNRELSMRRAEAVRLYLNAQLGVNPERLRSTGWGEDKPVRADNPNHPDNRRVEVINLGYVP